MLEGSREENNERAEANAVTHEHYDLHLARVILIQLFTLTVSMLLRSWLVLDRLTWPSSPVVSNWHAICTHQLARARSLALARWLRYRAAS